MKVVMPVLGGPPQDALLCGALTQQGEDELESSARGVSAVRKKPVIAGPDGEDAQPIEGYAENGCFPGYARPNGAETGKMNQQKGNR
jgi:hypothetical protein